MASCRPLAFRITITLATASGSELQRRQHWRVWRTLRFRPWVDGRVQRSCGISASRRANLQPSRAEWRRQEFFRPLLRTKSVAYPPHAHKSVSYLPCTFIKVLGSTNYYNCTLGDFCRTPHIMRQERGLAIAPPQNHDRYAYVRTCAPRYESRDRMVATTTGGTRYRAAASDHVN